MECSRCLSVVTRLLLPSTVALAPTHRIPSLMTVRSLGQANVPVMQRLAAVLAQLDRIVVGKPEALKLAVACLLARGHLLIEDIPGVGKSTLAQALAVTLGLKYARVQFTSDLLPADVLGVSIFDRETRWVPF